MKFFDLTLTQNGKTFDPQKDMKIVAKNFFRNPPNYAVEYSIFSGSNGSKEVSSSFQSFKITLLLDVFYKNNYDKELIMFELYNVFFPGYQYFLSCSLMPGLRYKVNPISMEQTEEESTFCTFEITFGVPSGCAESIATTLSDFSLDEEWQFSQGLVAEDYSYMHKTSRFTVFNGGSFSIDPREHYLRIVLEGESEGNATIFNRTTGERFIYYPPLSTKLGQSLVVEGVIPRLNGVSCGINTNHGLISLSEGVNQIEIQNITRVKSSWDFRFLYK